MHLGHEIQADRHEHDQRGAPEIRPNPWLCSAGRGWQCRHRFFIFIMDINNLHMTGGVVVKVLMIINDDDGDDDDDGDVIVMLMLMMMMMMTVVVRMVNLMRTITIPMTIGIITTMILSGLLYIEKCHLLFFRISMCVLS